MFILVVIVHVIVCLLIIAVVLLQAGKGADIGSAFGGTGSQAVFGSMGTPTLLGKITAGDRHRLHADLVLAGRAGEPPDRVDHHAGHARPARRRRPPAPPRPPPRRRPRPHRARPRPPRPLPPARNRTDAPPRRPRPDPLGGRRARRRAAGRESRARAIPRVRASAARAYGDTFVEASIGDIGALIPNLASDGPSHDVGGLIYDGLIRLDKNLNWIPAMAESWAFAPDCLTLTFKLRQDVKWHDGQPFTAADVVFTWKTLIHPKTPAPFKEKFLQIKDVEALDPYTVRVTYAQPYGRALETLERVHPAQAPPRALRGGGQASRVAAEPAPHRAPARTASRSGGAARRWCWSPTPTTTSAARTSPASSIA